MSNDSDTKESNLVSVGNKALTTRSSTLVRRGLETLAAQQPRIVRFPIDHSLGKYIKFDSDVNLSVETAATWFSDSRGLEFIAEAEGAVTLQPGQVLCLKVDDSASEEFSSFSRLNPNDLHTLVLDSPGLGDEELVHLQHLAELKGLSLSSNITDAGLLYLRHLRSLRDLSLRETKITDLRVTSFRVAGAIR